MDADRAGGLPEYGHSVGIAAERGDVSGDPFKRHQLIFQSHVSGHQRIGQTEKSERTESIVEGDEDDVPLDEEIRCVRRPGARRETASVDENHHRLQNAFRSKVRLRQNRRENVEIKAIFVADDFSEFRRTQSLDLGTLRPELSSVEGSIVGANVTAERNRISKAEFPYRRFRVRNAEESEEGEAAFRLAEQFSTFDGAEFGLDDDVFGSLAENLAEAEEEDHDFRGYF